MLAKCSSPACHLGHIMPSRECAFEPNSRCPSSWGATIRKASTSFFNLECSRRPCGESSSVQPKPRSAFTFAPLARWAAAIFLRAAADITRVAFAARFPVLEAHFAHRAFCARLIFLRAAADRVRRFRARLLPVTRTLLFFKGTVWASFNPSPFAVSHRSTVGVPHKRALRPEVCLCKHI
jgi:hypothetical protein